MQSAAQNTMIHPQPTVLSASQVRPLDKLERLAVARLQHRVNELQIQVNSDREAKPPARRAFWCICDDTALTASIPELKRLVTERSIVMIVPLAALDALDKLKKGSDEANVHAREAIRYFDRVQSAAGAGRKPINGVRIQDPTARFATWSECVAASSLGKKSPVSAVSTESDTEPPGRIKEVLNCVIHFTHKRSDCADDVFLVTNDEIMKEWAKVFHVAAVTTDDISAMVKREGIEFAERRRHYEYDQNHAKVRSPTSPTGGRGGRGGFRGGRTSFSSGSSSGSNGRHTYWEETPRGRMDPNGFGRGARVGAARDTSPPDYVLRSPPRGVARGRGKLWEP